MKQTLINYISFRILIKVIRIKLKSSLFYLSHLFSFQTVINMMYITQSDFYIFATYIWEIYGVAFSYG